MASSREYPCVHIGAAGAAANHQAGLAPGVSAAEAVNAHFHIEVAGPGLVGKLELVGGGLDVRPTAGDVVGSAAERTVWIMNRHRTAARADGVDVGPNVAVGEVIKHGGCASGAAAAGDGHSDVNLIRHVHGGRAVDLGPGDSVAAAI